MANLTKYREHRQFTGPVEVLEVEYDFSKDAGATGALTICKMKEACVLVSAYFKVDTTFTSGGSATLIWGISGTTNACMTTTTGAVANLTAGAVIVGASTSVHLKLAADETFVMTIGTAAMTAGKGRFVMHIQKF